MSHLPYGNIADPVQVIMEVLTLSWNGPETNSLLLELTSARLAKASGQNCAKFGPIYEIAAKKKLAGFSLAYKASY